jgi:acyl CoA:acetate/3-ketoacid CoA transferase beta subunit
VKGSRGRIRQSEKRIRIASSHHHPLTLSPLSSFPAFPPAGLTVIEVAEGVTFEEVQAKTGAKLHKAAHLGIF